MRKVMLATGIAIGVISFGLCGGGAVAKAQSGQPQKTGQAGEAAVAGSEKAATAAPGPTPTRPVRIAIDDKDGTAASGQTGEKPKPVDKAAVTDKPAAGDKATPNADPAAAQTQAEPPAATGWAAYTVHSSAEVGWRFLGNDGSFDKFRSDLNYDRGIRLFNSDFVARAPEGGGLLFDNLMVNAFGWGGDPSEYIRAQMEKTRWYRFDANYRKMTYFNDLAEFALGQHTADTVFRIGDFNLQLLPLNEKLRINLGYSFDNTGGTSLTTYDYQRKEFPILSPIQTSANDYRFGVDSKLWIFDLSFMQGFRFFKNDTTYNITAPTTGNEVGNTLLSTFSRDMPTRGRIPYSRFSVHTLVNKRVDFTGRLIYSNATSRFLFDETDTGVDASGNKILLDQTHAQGTIRRPDFIADAGISFYATDKLTISDSFRFNSFRINGANALLESLAESKLGIPLPPTVTDTTSFTFTNYRLFQNTIEADYKVLPQLSVHAGYRYTARHIELASLTEPPAGELDLEAQDNNTHSGFFGFAARPYKGWHIYADFERGQADNVFTRVSNYDYTNFRIRNLIKPTRNLTLNVSLVTKNDTNPALLTTLATQPFGVQITSRIFSSSLDWSPNSTVFVNAGYTYTNLTSNAQIIFFLNNVQQQGTSLYLVRDHSFYGNMRVQISSRASVFAGFRYQQDFGQGLQQATSPTQLLLSYPLKFAEPEARFTLRLMKQLDWNAGYQFFAYSEKLFNVQNYHATVAYASLTFRFDRE